MVHKFVMPKVCDYSNKLRRVGLGRCHREQKNYCFKFDGQIQVGTIEHFLIRCPYQLKRNFILENVKATFFERFQSFTVPGQEGMY